MCVKANPLPDSEDCQGLANNREGCCNSHLASPCPEPDPNLSNKKPKLKLHPPLNGKVLVTLVGLGGY